MVEVTGPIFGPRLRQFCFPSLKILVLGSLIFVWQAQNYVENGAVPSFPVIPANPSDMGKKKASWKQIPPASVTPYPGPHGPETNYLAEPFLNSWPTEVGEQNEMGILSHCHLECSVRQQLAAGTHGSCLSWVWALDQTAWVGILALRSSRHVLSGKYF